MGFEFVVADRYPEWLDRCDARKECLGWKDEVGDRVTVSLSAGRVAGGVVKAVINRTDGIRLQVDYGKDETALIYVWLVRAADP